MEGDRERLGVFTVAHKDGLQRLVVDPRPTHARWETQRRCRFHRGSCRPGNTGEAVNKIEVLRARRGQIGCERRLLRSQASELDGGLLCAAPDAEGNNRDVNVRLHSTR